MAIDLAKLVVRLEAETGKYHAELAKANARLEKYAKDTNKNLSSIEKRFRSFTNFAAGAIAVLGVGKITSEIIKATSEAEASYAKLEVAVRNNGKAAGFTAPQLSDMASELQRVSIFGDEAVMDMQGMLLSFRALNGPTFKRAQQSIIDVATALGTDLVNATKSVGRALADPEAAAGRLAKMGIVLSEATEKTIKQMVKQGDVVGAQNVILTELENRYKGAAEAGRNNFAGAIQAVKNAAGDLLEVKGGLPEVVDKLNALADILQDPAVKAGIEVFFGAIINGASAAVSFVSQLAGGIKVLAEDVAAAIHGPAADDIVRLEDTIAKYRAMRASNVYDEASNARLDAAIKTMEGLLADARKAATELDKVPAKSPASPTGNTDVPDIGIGGNAESRVKEVQITARRVELTAFEEFYRELDQMTKTHDQKTIESYYGQREALKQLLDDGIISWEDYQRRIGEILDSTFPEFEVTVKKVKEVSVEATNELTEFQKAAAQNSVGIIADALTDGFDSGIDGIIKSFGDMLVELAAQAVAADIAQYIFGDPKTGSGGLVNQAIAMFAGNRAEGGPVQAGMMYKVNEDTPRSEYFVPGMSGQIVPHEGFGGTQVTQVFHVEAPKGTISRQTQSQIGAQAFRGLMTASRRNN